MNNFIKKLKSMSYASSKNQEIQVENILKELKIDYVYQPNGTQKFPDFHIPKLKIDLECKSSIGKIPMWNCTYPKKEALYVFSSKAEKKTFVFFGDEIISEEISKIYEEYSIKHKQLQNEINEKLSKIDNKYKMKVFARNMFTQGAPMCKKINEKLGQYFTTDCSLLDNLLDDYDKVPKSILEPSSGEGNLLSLLDNKSIIDAIDIDNRVLEKSMENYPDVKHINTDFLTYESDKKYDLIIGNPPFFEIKKEQVPQWYKHLALGRTNIYYLFIYKCLSKLNENGELRFIIPKAFLSNNYSCKLREYIANNFLVKSVVFFEDEKMFKNAIQSVIIIKIIKTEPNTVKNKHIFKINNSTLFVKDNSQIQVSGITIKSLKCSVKTGSLIWNKYKDLLTDFPIDDTLELVYSSSVSQKNETNKMKKSYLQITDETRKHIVSAPFIAVQRIVGDKLHCMFINDGEYFKDCVQIFMSRKNQ
jgi:adenine-specific DNA-methyltransferase